MIHSKAFDLFCEKSAVSVMARALMEDAFSASHLDEVFAENAEQQEERDLPFSQLVDVMSLAVLQIRPSVNAAYINKKEEISVSIQSVYNKLSGIEPTVSRAMLRDSADRLNEVLDKMGCERTTQPGYRTKIVDGKHLNRTERRLKPLRELNRAPLPGTALAILDADRRLVCDVIPCEDGHAQERSLLGDVLDTVEKGDLWIADRNFCTVNFLSGIVDRGAHFVIRRHAHLPLQDFGGKRRVGKTETGTVYEQSASLPTAAGDMQVRLIIVKLKNPTRDGDKEIVVVSNLPKKVSARRIAELYRGRWTIETAFHQVAMALHGEIKTLAYPKAALFGFCIALVSHNLLNVVKAAIAAAQDGDEDDLSTYHLADEISSAYYGMMIVLPPKFWQNRFGKLTPSDLAERLIDMAQNVRWDRFQKARRGPKKPPPNIGAKTNRTHVSTKRVLDEAASS